METNFETTDTASNSWALGKNLLNAVKLALLRPVADEQLPVSWGQLCAFALIGLLPPLLGDIAQVGLHGHLSWQNLADALVHLPILLFAAIAAGFLTGRAERTLRLWQCFVMIAVVVDATIYLLAGIAPSAQAPSWLRGLQVDDTQWPLLWLAGACAIAAVQRIAMPVMRALTATTLCAVIILMPLTAMERERSLWQRSFIDAELAETQPGAGFGEDDLYNQRERLDRELAAVQPGRPGVAEIFFIGMAGYGGQEVFTKEVNAVSQLFQDRFGAAGRTIRLINNRKAAGVAPIASVTSLSAALKRVGQAMNRDEDILFLFLTSHGSKDHRFALDLWPLKFHDLGPARLRQLLDESGIKHRVVVVSACYSGGFVDALKSDHTLVIAASAPDKNSFGCSNEAQWTYFGQAYFDQALRKTYSFIEAFDIAKPAIAERERREDFEPSEPQIATGVAIKVKLDQLAKQLAARP